MENNHRDLIMSAGAALWALRGLEEDSYSSEETTLIEACKIIRENLYRVCDLADALKEGK